MEAILDRTAALERVEGDAELLQELVDLFLADAPERMADIRGALAARDAEALRKAAHSLKGAAANLSAVALASAAKRLEDAGRMADFATAAHACAALQEEIDRLQEALRATDW
jgi:two-component system sensor histidine kinase/response regulator